MDDLKQVVAEWILTNGKLPGFNDRLAATLPLWNVVKQEFVVYRGQGGVITPNISGLHHTEITSDVRPVIATSISPDSVVRYAGNDCCIYAITLKPGIRYIDVNKLISFIAPEGTGKRVIAIKDIVLQNVVDMCPPPSSMKFPSNATSPSRLRKAIMDRCFGRYNITPDGIEVLVPPELEIMVDGMQGQFIEKRPICPMIHDTITYTITYAPKPVGGRGRTLRRTSRRRNNNGRRPARKSENSNKRCYTRNR